MAPGGLGPGYMYRLRDARSHVFIELMATEQGVDTMHANSV